MTWAGKDRRVNKREEQVMNLDMTWQDAFYSMRREITILTDLVSDVESDMAALKQDMKLLLEARTEVKVGLRTAGFIGSGLFALVLGWDAVMSVLRKLFSS